MDSFTEIIKTLKQRSQSNGQILSVIQTDWPIVVKLIGRSYALLGLECSETAKHEVVEEALQAYKVVVFHGNAQKYPDPERIRIFIEALVNGIEPHLAEEYGGSRRNLRQMIFEDITDEKTQRVLRRAGYEQTALVCLAAGHA